MRETYEIQGREVTVPLHIPHATAGLAAFTASWVALAERLPPELEPVRLPGNRGVVVLMMVDYVDNPLGDYDEGVVAIAAQPRGRTRRTRLRDILAGRFGGWVAHMPVSQSFTREAGEKIWGYPKTHDELRIERAGDRASLWWGRDGETILELDVPAGGRLRPPPLRGTTYTVRDGVVHRTALTLRAEGMGIGFGARVRLGHHDVGRALDDLDLGQRALSALWIERAAMDFRPAVPLTARPA